MTNRTSAYRFTTTDIDSPMVQDLRRHVRILNAQRRVHELVQDKEQRRYRVVIRGRLGPNNVHAPLYRKGGEHYRRCSMTIRPEHASRFDVYVHELLPPLGKFFLKNG